MTLFWQIRLTPLAAACLALLAGKVGAKGQLEQAARLFGAADALDSDYRAGTDPTERAAAERNIAFVREQLGTQAFERAWAEGQAMPPEQAIAAALESD